MRCNNITIVGLQWGDEGKGKVVDRVSAVSRYNVRFCGGANAGHTVVIDGEKFALHLLPCGVLRSDVMNVIGSGVVFDPAVAREEIEGLRSRGKSVDAKNFRVSRAAQVVMPWHKREDQLSEQALGAGKIGTTARGIGPCYADRARRSTAVRVCDLVDPDALAEKIRAIGEQKNRQFAALYEAPPMDLDALAEQYVELGRFFAPMVGDTGSMLRKAIADGERILFEGAQGAMLDVDHGTFPFATSSSVSACGVPAGAGVPPSAVGRVIGLCKSYTTRVGAGPFPTEQDNELGQALRDRGNEYGTTTGRPRRCGWLDLALVRYTAELSGVHEIALGLLDVLSGMEQVQVCTGYRRGGVDLEGYDPTLLDDVEPVYETLPGWTEPIGQCRRFEDLPAAARQYVSRVEQVVGRPVGLISIGPDRDQVIRHHTELPVEED